MPNTTNYSFPTPADTDLVKNGADAIRDLGDAVDTAMNTALGTKKAGMVLLNTTSFSAVASQSLNNVFSATYENYRLVLRCTSSTNQAVNFRLRASGSDNSTTNYDYQDISADNTSLSGSRSTSQTSGLFAMAGAGSSSTHWNITTIDITNPFEALKTSSIAHGNYAAGPLLRIITNIHNVATSFDGITFFVGGTITGSISVYGYNK
jgi:hypothetical protein